MICKFGLYPWQVIIQTIVEEEAVNILIREKSLKEKVLLEVETYVIS